MKKRLLASFLVLFILGVLAGTQIPYGKQHTAPERDSDMKRNCQCPSLDELIIQEMAGVSMKLEVPIKREKKDIALSSEKTVIQEDEGKGVRIILRYDDKDTLLKRANTYGLTTNKIASQVPYYFTLNGEGERLYFMRDESFRQFLLDIGGRGILNKAQGKVVVRLASGSRFLQVHAQALVRGRGEV